MPTSRVLTTRTARTGAFGASGRNLDTLEARNSNARNLCADLALDRMNVTNVIRSHESVGLTAALRAPRPANTVRIGLGGAGDVVVDDVRHLIDVDTTRNNVGGHKDVESALTKALHGAISLSLGHVPLQCDRLVILAIEFLRETLGAVLGPRENNGRVESVFFEKLVEQIDLAILNDGIERVFDGLHWGRDGQLDHVRFAQHVVRQAPNLTRHGGREKEVLTRFG